MGVLKAANTSKDDPEGQTKIQKVFSAAWNLVKKAWNAIKDFFCWIGRNIAKLFSSKKETKIASEFVSAGKEYIENVCQMVPKQSVA